jgi:ABC-type dipeptide/oligopeptide/nickel transport system permease component
MALITFLIMHATPGSPLEPEAGNATILDPASQQALNEKYGLDKPLYQQFGNFVWNALHADFGTSYIYKGRSINEIIGATLPVSLHLGFMAFVFALIGGLILGTLGALNQNRASDYTATTLSALAISLPNFIIAVLLVLVLSLWLHLLPTGGWDTPDQWILPTITLGLGPLGYIARFARSSMLEVLHSDYIRTARAKGLASNRILLTHILKNSLSPVITVAGPILAQIGTGSFVIEAMFRVPGVGRYFVESMIGRDYPMIMAVILLYGTFLAIMNIIVDVLYALLDPRVRYT